MSRQDRILLPQFQKGNWEEKAKTYKSFQDSVLQYFGKLLIYEEQPDALSKEELSNIKKVIAEKLLTTNQRPWITFPDAFKKIYDLRQEKDADQKPRGDPAADHPNEESLPGRRRGVRVKRDVADKARNIINRNQLFVVCES